MSKKHVDLVVENSNLKLENAELRDKLSRVEKRLKTFAMDGLQDLYKPRMDDWIDRKCV